MTLSALQLLSVLLCPLVLGLAVLSCAGLEVRAERALAAALAYVAGCAALAGVTTVWLLCGAPLEGSALPLAVLALAALLFLLGARGAGCARAPRPTARREAVLWATVALLSLLLLIRDLYAARVPVMWGACDEGQN
ncbi:MAG: hypothetical protein EXS08_10595 [Planctomycetes bacterium]|nr:hypothetical protein [Planctomycetota bacterium]